MYKKKKRQILVTMSKVSMCIIHEVQMLGTRDTGFLLTTNIKLLYSKKSREVFRRKRIVDWVKDEGENTMQSNKLLFVTC